MAGHRLRRVVEGVVEGTLQLTVDQWWAVHPCMSCAEPNQFTRVFSRRDPRAMGSRIRFN